QKAFVGGDKPTLLFHGQGEVKAVISRMARVDRKPRCGLKQRPRRQQFDFRALEKTRSEQGFLSRKFVPLDLFPENVRALSHEQLGCDQLGAPKKCERLRRAVL